MRIIRDYSMIMLLGIPLLTAVAVIIIRAELNWRDTTHDQVVAVAEDLGCTYIEQSYYHPENFYIDCGNDEIRIIKMEK